MPLTSDKRVKFTHKYNIFNNMKCPSLMGDIDDAKAKNVGTYKIVSGVADNLFNYAASYPVSGYSTKSGFLSLIHI